MALMLFVILSMIWVIGGAWWSWRHNKKDNLADILTLYFSMYIVFGFLVIGLITLLMMKVLERFGFVG